MLVSFSLAAILWFIVTLNQEYDITISFPIRMVDIPEEIQFEDLLIQKIDVQAKGAGGDLIASYLKSRRDTLPLPLDGKFTDYRARFVQSIVYKPEISKYMGADIQIIGIVPERIYFTYQDKIHKRVPISLEAPIRLRPGYQLEIPPILLEDSVTLYGTSEALDTVSKWYTTTQPTRLVDRQTVLRIAVMDTIEGISVEEEEVEVQLKPRLYTQARVEMEVMIDNAPADTKVRLSHDKVRFDFLVPVDDYDDFIRWSKRNEVHISFTDLNPDWPHLVPDPPTYGTAKLISRLPEELNFVIVRL